MSLPTSRLSYTDCYELLDKALADPHGVRYKCKNSRLAEHFKSRLHYARTLDRRDNVEIYAEGEPLHGRSTYDVLKVAVRHVKGEWYVYILRIELEHGNIESLEGVADAGI